MEEEFGGDFLVIEGKTTTKLSDVLRMSQTENEQLRMTPTF